MVFRAVVLAERVRRSRFVTVVPSRLCRAGSILLRGIGCPGHAPPLGGVDPAVLGRPWALWPARLRRAVEVHTVVALAGQVAVDLHLARGDVAGPQPPLPELEQPEPEPLVLPEAEQAVLEYAAAGDGDSDVSQAAKVLGIVCNDDFELVAAHLALAQREAQLLLSGQRARRMVLVLAAELVRHRTLPAKRWKAVLAGAA
jgi:hypothetical protein